MNNLNDNYNPQVGDVVLSDSNRFGAKCVKFFMQSPTVWHQIYKFIIKKLEKVEYYHVAMILNNGLNGFTNQTEIIEQQKLVRLVDWNPNRKQIIFRKLNLTKEDKEDLKQEALSDIGQKYDVLNIFGKLLTWLTGIKWFCRYIESKNKEICVNRVCKWYWNTTDERFSVLTHSELTTQTLYKYLINNENWQIVYYK